MKKKGCVCRGSPHKHKNHTHTPSNWHQIKKKEKKKGTQRMWRPLCFHLLFKCKKKNKWNENYKKVVVVCVSVYKKYCHTYEHINTRTNTRTQTCTQKHTATNTNTHQYSLSSMEELTLAWRCRFESCSEWMLLEWIGVTRKVCVRFSMLHSAEHTSHQFACCFKNNQNSLQDSHLHLHRSVGSIVWAKRIFLGICVCVRGYECVCSHTTTLFIFLIFFFTFQQLKGNTKDATSFVFLSFFFFKFHTNYKLCVWGGCLCLWRSPAHTTFFQFSFFFPKN